MIENKMKMNMAKQMQELSNECSLSLSNNQQNTASAPPQYGYPGPWYPQYPQWQQPSPNLNFNSLNNTSNLSKNTSFLNSLNAGDGVLPATTAFSTTGGFSKPPPEPLPAPPRSSPIGEDDEEVVEQFFNWKLQNIRRDTSKIQLARVWEVVPQ
ncbi:MAG: hypothetical protein L6R36_009194 [Xanthoria steineri]|nr:MAG: hypothetical protein L6R36_009194 [Xanthoria steineri]